MKGVIKDGLKAFLSGLLFAASVGIIAFLAGLIYGGSVEKGLEICKSGLLILLAGGLFITAGMLLMSGKNTSRFDGKESWQKHFKVLGYKSVILVFCTALLLAAAAVDLVLVYG